MPDLLTCLHCKIRKGQKTRRGLCQKCHKIPGVKELYPTRIPWNPPKAQTEEEVEALVAESMSNLPDWWERSEKTMKGRTMMKELSAHLMKDTRRSRRMAKAQ